MGYEFTKYSFTELLSNIVDNRGKTCPVDKAGLPLIATNCVKNDALFPTFKKVRYVNQETYDTWFRGHPEPGDMIFVCKGSPGDVCWTPDPVNFCIAQDRGKGEKHPGRGVKEILKPCAYKELEHVNG